MEILRAFGTTATGSKKEFYRAIIRYYKIFGLYVKGLESIFTNETVLQNNIAEYMAFACLNAKKSGGYFDSNFENDKQIGFYGVNKDLIIEVVNNYPEDLLDTGFLRINNHKNIDVSSQFFPYYVDYVTKLINDVRQANGHEFGSLTRLGFFQMYAKITEDGFDEFCETYSVTDWGKRNTRQPIVYDSDLEDELRKFQTKHRKNIQDFFETGTNRRIQGTYQSLEAEVDNYVPSYYNEENNGNGEDEQIIEDGDTFEYNEFTLIDRIKLYLPKIIIVGVLGFAGYSIFRKIKNKGVKK